MPSGGFLRCGRSTLLIGVEEQCVPRALEVLRENCTEARSPQEKKATVFVLSVDEFTQL